MSLADDIAAVLVGGEGMRAAAIVKELKARGKETNREAVNKLLYGDPRFEKCPAVDESAAPAWRLRPATDAAPPGTFAVEIESVGVFHLREDIDPAHIEDFLKAVVMLSPKKIAPILANVSSDANVPREVRINEEVHLKIALKTPTSVTGAALMRRAVTPFRAYGATVDTEKPLSWYVAADAAK